MERIRPRPVFNIIHAKVEDFLRSIPPNSLDACLCDPPYLLEFMGKAFDRQHKKMAGENDGQRMQAWHEKWTLEVLRVLKPGAHMLAFGGTRTYHRLASAAEDVGFEVRDTLCWLHGQGFPKGKTQLKPAHEPILLAKKRGKGEGLAVDECRIAGTPGNPGNREDQKPGDFRRDGGYRGNNPSTYKERVIDQGLGRWPANLLLDEESAAMLDEQGGERKTGRLEPHHKLKCGSNLAMSGSNQERNPRQSWGGESGGASRFFYTAKVSPRERNLSNIPCTHPTLKPIALTTYLARLLLPPTDVSTGLRRILIPFSGAGSEIAGALLAGWDYALGIEMYREYVDLANERVPAAFDHFSGTEKGSTIP